MFDMQKNGIENFKKEKEVMGKRDTNHQHVW